MSTEEDPAYQDYQKLTATIHESVADDERILGLVKRRTEGLELCVVWLLGAVLALAGNMDMGWGFWGWVVGFPIVALELMNWSRRRQNGSQQYSAAPDSETYVRLRIAAELHARGELRFVVEDGRAIPDAHQEWDCFWEQALSTIQFFRGHSFNDRRRAMKEALKVSLSARRALEAFARVNQVSVPDWAKIQSTE